MKRGLKDVHVGRRPPNLLSYNRFPDEKGTERRPTAVRRRRSRCYNRFPDEKGTESLILSCSVSFGLEVTTVSPMKRGLKVSVQRTCHVPTALLQPFPR